MTKISHDIIVETKGKQYPFLQNNRLLLQTMTAQAAQVKHWLLKPEQNQTRSTAIYTTELTCQKHVESCNGIYEGYIRECFLL